MIRELIEDVIGRTIGLFAAIGLLITFCMINTEGKVYIYEGNTLILVVETVFTALVTAFMAYRVIRLIKKWR